MNTAQPGILYLVPTPIGNLGDITLRALEILKTVDSIVCEDTRQTRKLLNHYQIQKETISFHDHSSKNQLEKLTELLVSGQSVAYVSDAGMPLIADPGFVIVREAVRNKIKVEALPGACAAITALAASGLHAETFSFLGFLPPKSGSRKNKLELLKDRPETLIFYESPYRILKMLEDVYAILGDREVVLGRELTKKFEEYVRGKANEVKLHFEKNEPMGEFVVMVAGKDRKNVLS